MLLYVPSNPANCVTEINSFAFNDVMEHASAFALGEFSLIHPVLEVACVLPMKKY